MATKRLKNSGSNINVQQIMKEIDNEKAFLQSLDENKLRQFDQKELEILDALLKQCEDIIYEIKSDLNERKKLKIAS